MVNTTGLLVACIQFVPNMVIKTICDDKQTVREKTVQSVTLAGLSVNVPDKPVTFPDQSGTFMV